MCVWWGGVVLASAWVAGQVVADSSAATFSQRFPQREVTHGNIALDPRMAYIVVPHTLSPKLENTFLLRVFSEAEVGVVECVMVEVVCG